MTGRNLKALRVANTQCEQRVLRRFIEVYCHAHHGASPPQLCEECLELWEYALAKLGRCPYDPKPKYKHCPTHCYKPGMRDRIKQVMRFSGIYNVKRGRLDWLIRYFLT